jgi:hypothetical protein
MFSMRLRRFVFSGLVLAVVALGPGAVSGLGKTRTIPTIASGSGTDTIPVLGGSTFIADGTASGTLGSATFHLQGTQTGPTSFILTETSVFAHGTLTESGMGTDTGPNTSTVILTITSGTGRFRGSSGSSTVMSTTSPTADPQVRQLTFTSTGTITLKHKGKKHPR